MSRIELYKPDADADPVSSFATDADADPVSSFATDADIELADQLRHQLEERYLAHPAPASPCCENNSPSLRPVDDAGGAP